MLGHGFSIFFLINAQYLEHYRISHFQKKFAIFQKFTCLFFDKKWRGVHYRQVEKVKKIESSKKGKSVRTMVENFVKWWNVKF